MLRYVCACSKSSEEVSSTPVELWEKEKDFICRVQRKKGLERFLHIKSSNEAY